MTNQHGDFIWYELLTSNADAAGEFYGKVVGWTSTSAGKADMDYRFFSSGDGSDNKDGVGGYMAITPEMAEHGARPAWVGYIAVDDVDAAVAKLTEAGGAVLMPALDIDGVGRMAMVADPQGAPFYIMNGASAETSYSFAATEPKIGHCAWNELASSDPEAAKAFYGSQFGWVSKDSMDMGLMGSYDFLQVGNKRGFNLGAVYTMVPQDPQPHWLFYFRVSNLDRAIAAITDGGGQIYQQPIAVPGGIDFSLIAIDPHGAPFGLIGPQN